MPSDEIRLASEAVDKAELALNRATEARKIAKTEFDDAVARLRAVARPLPLLDEVPDWRSVSTAKLSLPLEIINKLPATLGQVRDYEVEHGDLTELVGDKADDVADAIDRYFGEHGND